MNCYISGIIGIGLLFATFATMTMSKKYINRLKRKLSPELAEIYCDIARERRDIYFQGLILGLIIAILLLYILETKNTFHRITFALATTIIISIVYYLLMPKSDYMLNHLNTVEQNKAWLKVYKSMRYRYLFGFIFGSISVIPLTHMFCKE
jgi:uncharacterized protein YacL